MKNGFASLWNDNSNIFQLFCNIWVQSGGCSSCFCTSKPIRTSEGLNDNFDVERNDEEKEKETEPPPEAIVIPSDSDGKLSFSANLIEFSHI